MKIYYYIILLLISSSLSGEEKTTVVLYPRKSINLAFSLNGTIEKYYYKVGDRVEKNKVIAEINKTYYDNFLNIKKKQLKESELYKEYSKKNLTKKKELFDKGALGQNQLAESKLSLSLAEIKTEYIKSEIRLAEYELNLCSIKSPFNAFISKIKIKQHEYIQKGEVALELIDDSAMYAIFYISSFKIKNLPLGTKINISINETNKIYQAEICEISSKIEPSSHTIKLKALINNKDFILKEGMTGALIMIND